MFLVRKKKVEPQIHFAYGSDLSRKQMAVRCPEAIYLGVAKLKDWKFQYDGDGNSVWSNMAVANVLPETGSTVWGVLYQLSGDDVRLLDIFEHVPVDYHHVRVTVLKQDGTGVVAYLYTRENEPLGAPSKKYMETVISGAKDVGIPEDYINKFLKVTAK